jgi:two-component sensor histidine kinase
LLTLIALLPATLLLSYNLYSVRVRTERGVRDEALRLGELGSLELQRIISGAENVMIAFSAEPAIYDHDIPDCQNYLARLGDRLPQFTGIALTDANGVVVCSQHPAAIGVSLADRDYIKEALRTGQFTVGTYTEGRVSKQAVLPLGLPVVDKDGKTIAIVIAPLRIDWLNAKLGEHQGGRGSAFLVIDRIGTIIARIPDPHKFVGTNLTATYHRLLSVKTPATFTAVGLDGVDRIIGYYPASDARIGLGVAFGISTDEAYGTIRHTFTISLIITIASVLLSIMLAWLTSTRLIRRPVGVLVDTIRAWRGGDEAARTGMSERRGELGIVGKAIDDFLQELVAARRATADAEARRELLVHELDHRIKNLLATVQSVAQQTFKETAKPQDAVRIFSRRLNALSEAHALLMRTDGQSANLCDVVAAAIRPFANEEAPQFDISGPSFPVKVKAVLSLSMALHELCTNAVKYGALCQPLGRVVITWSMEEGDSPESARFHLAWTEHGGPDVVPPQTFGFGSKMIERVLGYELEAVVETRYPATGLEFRLSAPLARFRLSSSAAAPAPIFAASAGL